MTGPAHTADETPHQPPLKCRPTLLGIPLELRNKIYEQVFYDATIIRAARRRDLPGSGCNQIGSCGPDRCPYPSPNERRPRGEEPVAHGVSIA